MGAHILVVDDDPLLAAALRRPLAYLGKPFAFEELLVRIKALLRRGRNGSTSAELRFGDVRMDRSTREVWRGERTITLTRQEFDLLALTLAAFGLGVYTYVSTRLHRDQVSSFEAQARQYAQLVSGEDGYTYVWRIE